MEEKMKKEMKKMKKEMDNRLCEILNRDIESANRMMPTQKGANAVRKLNRSRQRRILRAFHEMDRWEWYRMMCQNDINTALFFGLTNGGKQKFQSVMNRCKMLVKLIQRDPLAIKSITILDGHGRSLFCLLHALKKTGDEDLMAIRIIVVDRDEAVHDWHDEFFPSDVELIHGDIYRQPKLYRSSNLIYFNFCAIGGREGIDRFTAVLTENFRVGDSCLVSFSSRGFGQENTPETLFRNRLPNFRRRNMTPDNKGFLTLRFTRQQEEEEEKEEEGTPLAIDRRQAMLRALNALPLTKASLIAFTDKHNLSVKTNFGGRASRTLVDFRDDIVHAI